MTASIALFTRDLRVHDNPVLTAAYQAGEPVIPLFVLDDGILAGFATPNRVRFLLAALTELDAELRALGSHLVVRRGDTMAETARIAEETGAHGVHIAADVSGYSVRRADRLRARLSELDCALHVHGSSVTAVDPGVLRPSGGGDHFAVFTPYFRRWVEANERTPLSGPRRLAPPPVTGIPLPEPADLRPGPSSPQLVVGGSVTGRKVLREWVSGPIDDYAERADRLDFDATSHLSPYLHFGCLSTVQILAAVDSASEGGRAFVRQLAWRDFHHQVLAARPDAAWSDYRSRPNNTWRDDPQAVRAWQAGETGFPVVDAGMRQLRAQGWMPGRARLIVAGFLTKSLGVDWRIGARYFLDWLVDADLANNQLNWQWAAGTGTDTRPNRKLNPLRQADRFDPDGTYVRRWLPELADLAGNGIHRPWRENIDPATYPAPIVECAGM
ncbi:deoxyribodipyrimidine photo-lyase [Nocardia cyriacigeorgica]|uniref:cryptochrome/photolyase family protein n=1 Tax=Nocardia cyriacigeorgica TaxID=135487 RepID=UPI0018945FE8|nr:deoxyribodipyrimidine photo-lyase [Nocardia cyriacigeorgica]MBF6097671.1 deoxyribodipyrimidine photo-lyase [Nocardia cyriacigeorgica]MBF6161685.1 deoxyribodipyrimidine photo-lyase [Nocardia cyriacigeorgica]MBF6200483.1 deoxyribodipyrimidine photo-lyase [Nocardia cyriacigeorgica]MBF6342052.1 deoxyribodipyrimidine photo-lyase [Nocardia cyriacigeorgica]MBF6512984.1 deoxyribodipyrimidine photo-lyase [Nocardia cyriacigeorgica]